MYKIVKEFARAFYFIDMEVSILEDCTFIKIDIYCSITIIVSDLIDECVKERNFRSPEIFSLIYTIQHNKISIILNENCECSGREDTCEEDVLAEHIAMSLTAGVSLD